MQTMTNGHTTAAPAAAVAPVKTIKLKPTKLTPENWKPYGQIVGPSFDGKEFDSDDAQLDLSGGIPRFYIMHLEDRKSLTFDRITHHASVTQCLGSIGGRPWYLGVAPASVVQTSGEPHNSGVQQPPGVNSLWSKAGHSYTPPAPEDVRVFRVDGPQFLKLHAGTWHAGPYFTSDSMNFYNLELSGTNVSNLCIDCVQYVLLSNVRFFCNHCHCQVKG
jgi:ureidoglycolate hydrolase